MSNDFIVLPTESIKVLYFLQCLLVGPQALCLTPPPAHLLWSAGWCDDRERLDLLYVMVHKERYKVQYQWNNVFLSIVKLFFFSELQNKSTFSEWVRALLTPPDKIHSVCFSVVQKMTKASSILCKLNGGETRSWRWDRMLKNCEKYISVTNTPSNWQRFWQKTVSSASFLGQTVIIPMAPFSPLKLQQASFCIRNTPRLKWLSLWPDTPGNKKHHFCPNVFRCSHPASSAKSKRERPLGDAVSNTRYRSLADVKEKLWKGRTLVLRERLEGMWRSCNPGQ